MTVFMVKKYLVRKLGLANEDEVISFSLSLTFSQYFSEVSSYYVGHGVEKP